MGKHTQDFHITQTVSLFQYGLF